MKQNQIISTAFIHFERLTGWKIEFKKIQQAIDNLDGEITLSHHKVKANLSFYVEIKNEMRSNDVYNLIQKKDKYSGFLLLAQYISKPNREFLKERNINYLESSGNCYIEKDGFFILVENQKVMAQRQTNNSKLYTESGMKFVYAGLLNDDFVKKTYREIAGDAEIALGNVGSVLESLEEEGFIQLKNGVRILRNKDKLFDIWANNFAETMRPHLFQTRLAFADKKNIIYWKSLELKEAFWGGEPAAALLDGYLIPQQFIIYSNQTLPQLMKQYKLVPDMDGNVIYMLPPFHNKGILPKKADPFIIYAELIQNQDDRCFEAAQRIKKKYIDPTF